MGKKRIIKKGASDGENINSKISAAKSSKMKLDKGILHVRCSYNNSRILLTDINGNAVFSSSSGAIGFSGAKKGTPFAAAKVGELVGSKAEAMGVKEVDVVVRGLGAGRESSIRGFASKGIQIGKIKDATPVPHNGPRPKKPRRV